LVAGGGIEPPTLGL